MSIIKEVILRPRFSTEDLNATATQAKTALQPINQLGQEIEQTFKEAFSTKEVKEFGKEVQQTTTKVVSAKAQLRAIKQELIGLDEGSKRFKQLSVEAGILEDRIGDVNARVRRLASDTQGLDALLGAAQGIAGGFAIAQGAAALLGEENEDLQKALLKVQASLSVLNGLQAVAATLNKDSAFSVIALSKAKQFYTFATGGATLATNAFRAALIATGVGAAVVALGTIIAYWNEIIEAIGKALNYLGLFKETQIEVTNNTKEYNEKIKETIALEEDLKKARDADKTLVNKIRNLRLEISLLQSLGASQKDINAKSIELKKSELEQSLNKLRYIELLIKERGESQILITKREEEKQQYASITAELNKLTKAAENVKKLQIDMNEIALKIGEDLYHALLSQSSVRNGIIDSINKGLDDEAKKRELQAKIAKTLNDVYNSIPEEVIEGEKDLPLTFRVKLATDKAFKKDFERLITDTAIEFGNLAADTLFQIGANNRKAEFDAELANLTKIKDARLQNEDVTAQEKLVIQAQFDRDLAKLREQQFKREQQAAVAQAILNGALAITTLAAKTPPAIGGVPNPAFFAGLALLVGQTAAQVAIIKSTPPPAFKEGVIDFKGKGTGTSDSNHVMISRGESVMTAMETKEHGDALMAIRKGQFDKFVNQRAFELERYSQVKTKTTERRSNIRKKGTDRMIIENFDQIGASVASRLNYAGYTKRR